MDFNKVILNGRITKDAELRGTTNGTSIVRFSLAVEDYTGNVTFFDCKAWRDTAEFISRYFRKGDGMLIEGHIEKSTFDARLNDGTPYQKTVVEVVCDRVFFAVGTKARGDGNLPAQNAIASFTAREAANNFKPEEKEAAFTFEEVQDDENLPF